MRKLVTMRHALRSADYFGTVLEGDSWAAWRVLLLAIVGEPLTDVERVVYAELTGRVREPTEPVRQFFGIVGRRGGKSRAMGTLAAFLAGCCDFRDVLAPGQRARLPLIAASKEQADELFAYVVGAFEGAPALRGLVDKALDRTLELRSQVDVQVRALSFRNLRGSTNVAVIMDELAYWRSDESATPDAAVLDALKPSLATTHGPLIGISSPYSRKGVLYRAFARDYGATGRERVLVAKGGTRLFNPEIDQTFLDDAFADDPVAADAEYNANFRSDIEAFVSREIIEACVVPSRRELPPIDSVLYSAFVDPSGGSAESMTLCIAHKVDDITIIDAIREFKPPFSPDQVVEEFSSLLLTYRVSTIVGDRYAGEWPRERFLQHGVFYDPSAKPKSDLFRDSLAALNAGRVELLDHPKLVQQLVSLERRTARSGKDSVDHPPGGHDDVCNAVCGVIVHLGNRKLSLTDVLFNDEETAKFAQQLIDRQAGYDALLSKLDGELTPEERYRRISGYMH